MGKPFKDMFVGVQKMGGNTQTVADAWSIGQPIKQCGIFRFGNLSVFLNCQNII